MARLAELKRRITRQLSGSPLDAIGVSLDEVIDHCVCAMDGAPDDDSRTAHGHDLFALIDRNLRLLPAQFGDRYAFDAWLLQTLLIDLEKRGAPVSASATPVYGQGWAYARLHIPLTDSARHRSVHLYWFSGEDLAVDIDLRSYRWLFHEVAHQLMKSQAASFERDLTQALSEVMNQARTQLFSVGGEAKRRLKDSLHQMEHYWSPTSKHEDWAHEIAMDVLALYMAGPCYAHHIHDALLDGPTDLFDIKVGHPPFALRVIAIRNACSALGHAEAAQMLDAAIANLIDAGEVKQPPSYSMYARLDMVDATVSAALSCAKTLGVPAFNEQAFLADTADGSFPDNGFTAIILADAKRRSCDAATYRTWEETFISAITTP